MQSTFINLINYLELYFTELPDFCIIVQANFKYTDRSTALTTDMLTLFSLVKYSKLSITCLF